MKKKTYIEPVVQILEFTEQVMTYDLPKTSNPEVDGTSVLVSWLIG